MDENNKQNMQDKLNKIKQNHLSKQQKQITNNNSETAKIIKAAEESIDERFRQQEIVLNNINNKLANTITQRDNTAKLLTEAKNQLQNAQDYDQSLVKARQQAVVDLTKQWVQLNNRVDELNQALDQKTKERDEALQKAVEDGLVQKKIEEETLDDSEDAQWLKTRKKKYKNVHKLDASQDDPAKRKYINFKQDYVVVIRKKPFYAATAQQRYSSKKTTTTYTNAQTGTIFKTDISNDVLRDKQGRQVLPEDNFLRAYQINNFMNISITSTVHGPGTCSVTMKGAERVIWAENDQESAFGFYNWSDLVGSWINTDEKGVFGDGTGTSYTAGSANRREDVAADNRAGKGDTPWARHETYGTDYAINQSWKQSTNQWVGVKEDIFDADTTFRTLHKTREAKYGWRFAEKCDWEPMDEIQIFGRSHTLRVDDQELDDNQRDPKTGMLLGYNHNNQKAWKMEPLFFGYIESINKTYDASRGCMISINAKDHLKLLEICLACTNAGALTGGHGGGPPAINWNLRYGLAGIENPILARVKRADGTIGYSVSYEEFKNNQWPSLNDKAANYAFLMSNILSGLYIDEIVQLMSAASGIPDKFLTQRVEPMHHVPPFWQDKIGQNLDVMAAQTDTRYALCQKAAQRLMLELFADEEGNIVLKIPNWVLGANLLKKNNCNIKYYDDLRYSSPPNFFIDENGMNVEPPEPADSTGIGKNILNELLGGFLSKVLSVISNIFNFNNIGKILGISTQEKKDTKVELEKNKLEKNNRDEARNTVESQTRERYARKTVDPTGMAVLWGLAGGGLFGLEDQEEENKENKENNKGNNNNKDLKIINTRYANITDTVINDILDETNTNVIQIDDYRIKVKVNSPSDTQYGSLYALAKRYYHNKYKWHLIAEINQIREPTELLPDTWVTIYFDDAISDYVINSFDDDNIHTNINKLKQDKINKLKKLGISQKKIYRGKQLQKNEYVISSFPFVIGEIISSPGKKLKQNNIVTDSVKQQYNNMQLNDTDKVVQTNEKILNEAEARKQALYFTKSRLDDLENHRAYGATTTGNQRFRSQRTDMDIPIIPNEYVISFTLTDSDANVYNYIEVAGSLMFGVQEGQKGNIPSIFRCIPDLDHIYQFGLRQHPAVNCSPVVAGPDAAEILGAMLLYKSQCNRYTGVLNCIEDSAIKVGNPVRMYIYDEHPFDTMKRFGLSQNLTEGDEKKDYATDATGSSMYEEKVYREQAVFYVESITRNIDIQGVSTMSLQLSGGRVMGMTNSFDALSLMYDLYYLPWQSRMYYYKNGGNNTALVNPQEEDISKQKAAHQAAREESRWSDAEKIVLQRKLTQLTSQVSEADQAAVDEKMKQRKVPKGIEAYTENIE